MMGYFALQLTSQVSYEKGLLQKTGELLNFKKKYIYIQFCSKDKLIILHDIEWYSIV